MEIFKVSGAPASGASISGVSDWRGLSGYYDTPFMEFRFDTTLGDGLPELTFDISGLAGAPPGVSNFVDWDDGTTLEEVSGATLSHTYSTGGVYDIKVSGYGLLTANNDLQTKLTDIPVFVNTLELQQFSSSSELTSISSPVAPVLNSGAGVLLLSNNPKLSSVSAINSWDVSGVTNLGSAFFNSLLFNQPLSNWVVSGVTLSMGSMFQGATSFNQDISSWDVSNAGFVGSMFFGASSFDQDLGAWTFKDSCIINFIFNNSGMSDANVALCLEGWDSVGQGTSVDATDMFGTVVSGGGPRTLSESTYPNAKTAYDNLIANNSWDFTGSFNWIA